MPPKPSEMKQKSLMNFFTKPTDAKATSTKKPAAKPQPKLPLDASKPGSHTPKTPEKADIPALSSPGLGSTMSSGGGSSVKQTPPDSSDPIDVDMLSAEEEKERVPVKSVSALASSICIHAYIRWNRHALSVRSSLTIRTMKRVRRS